MSDAVKIALIGLVCPLATLFFNRLFSLRDQKANNGKESLETLKKKHEADIAGVNEELTIICYGVLASLKGLAEKGCDGPVHDAIDHLEKHLNRRAHE